MKFIATAAGSMMNQRWTIVRNVLSSYAALLIQTLVRFAQLGIFVRALGADGLGLFTLLLAVPTISQISGYSLSKATVRFMSLSMAKKDEQGWKAYFSSSFAAYAMLSVIAAVAIASFYPLLEGLLRVPPALLSDAKRALLIVAVGVMATLPFNCAQGACQAAQRHDLLALVRSCCLLLQLAAYFLAFHFHILTVSLAFLILFGTRAVESQTWIFLARRAFPGISLFPLRISQTALKAILAFTGAALLIDLANIVGYEGFKLLLGAKLPLEVLGAYGVFAALAEGISIVTSAAAGVLMPVSGRYHALKDEERLGRLFYFASKLLMLVTVGMVFPILPFLKRLLSLMISPYVATHWKACAVLLLGQVVTTTGLTASVMLTGAGLQRMPVRVTLWWVICGVLASFFFLYATGSLIWPLVTISLARGLGAIWLSDASRRVFSRMNAGRYWLQVLVLPVTSGIACALGAVGLSRIPSALLSSGVGMAMTIVLEIASFAALSWFVLLAADERQEFILLLRPNRGPTESPT